ncbi:MAG TPA: hypothetical protein VGZ27_07410 [Vicinamibacterales bacterium]|jgi:hypothetical protein|nr:hypothetical protein [Vicinamibacterales bacterium]
MKEQDLDQLIDSAAAQIVRREPSDAMTAGVMDRVNRLAPASGRPRLVWAGLAAAAVLATLVVVFHLQRTPPRMVETPPVAVRQAPARSVAPPAPAFTQNFVFEQVPRAQASSPKILPPAVVVADEQDAVVPLITIEPISSPPPIQVPGIEVASTPVEEIGIEPLHIEPLSASND